MHTDQDGNIFTKLHEILRRWIEHFMEKPEGDKWEAYREGSRQAGKTPLNHKYD